MAIRAWRICNEPKGTAGGSQGQLECANAAWFHEKAANLYMSNLVIY